MELSGITGKFLGVSEWVMFFLTVNLLWLLFNLPIIYFSVSLLFVGSTEELHTLLVLLLIMTPLIFVPATTAMFAIVRKKIMGNYAGALIQQYWKFYRSNYLRSLVGGLIFIPLWVIWGINFTLANSGIGSPFFYFYMIITSILLTFTNYFLADSVHFTLNVFASLRKSIFMVVGYIHYTIGLTIVAGVTIFLIYAFHPALAVLFSGSIIAYIYFFGYYQIYRKAQGKVNEL